MRLRKPGSRASESSKSSARERAAKRAEAKARPEETRPGSPRSGRPRRVGVPRHRGAAKRARRALSPSPASSLRIPAAAVHARRRDGSAPTSCAAWLWRLAVLRPRWRLVGRAFVCAQRARDPGRVDGRRRAPDRGRARRLAVGRPQRDLGRHRRLHRGRGRRRRRREVTTKTVGSAHAWMGVPLAIVAALMIVGSARGRPGLARAPDSGRRRRRRDQPARRPAGGARRGNEAIAYESVDGRASHGFLGTTRVRRRPHPPRTRARPSPRSPERRSREPGRAGAREARALLAEAPARAAQAAPRRRASEGGPARAPPAVGVHHLRGGPVLRRSS